MKLIILLIFIINTCLANSNGSTLLENSININFKEQGRLSTGKLESFRKKMLKRRSEVFSNIVNYQTVIKDKKLKKATSKARYETEIKVYDLILEYLDYIEANSTNLDVDDYLQKILELEYSLRVEGQELPIIESFKWAKEIIKTVKISKHVAIEGEALNLYNSVENRKYTSEEIKELKERGVDLSTLDPVPSSSFWKANSNISDISIKNNYEGGTELYQGVEVFFPKNQGVFKKVRKTQTKPKIDITTIRNGKKVKFKIKTGLEMHSEPTAAALISAIGYHIDLSQYQRDFRVVFEKDKDYKEFIQDWAEYYHKYDLNKYLKDEGRLDTGEKYIVFHEVLVELKPEELIRVGPWAYGNLGHRGLREVRGLLLFNMWVANNDLKEAANNKLVLKKNVVDDFDFYHYQHDLGFAFGRFFREKVSEFSWNLVKSNNKDDIIFNYWNFQPNTGFDHVTYYDAKWMVRKIAQLTRDQIVEAVELGGWPKDVQSLLVEKLIARRNQLVKTFDLDKEYTVLPVDFDITTPSNHIQNGVMINTQFNGFTQDFGRESHEILTKIFKSIEKHATKGMIWAAKNFNSFVLDPKEFGYDSDIIGEIVVDIDRKVKKNPKPKGRSDNYLVEDLIRIKIGLGAGVVVRGRLNYIKEYRLIYPVGSQRDALYQNKFIVNALLPYTLQKGNMPNEYVLFFKDSFEGEAELYMGEGVTPINITSSIAKGLVNELIISKKVNSYTIHKDITPYTGIYAKLYAQMLILRLPIWQYSGTKGKLNRSSFKVKLKKGNIDDKLSALTKVVRFGDFSEVSQYAKETQYLNTFSQNKHEVSFFKLLEFRSNSRVDDIVYNDEVNKSKKDRFQVGVKKRFKWSFLGNEEDKQSFFRLNGKKSKKGKLKKYYVESQLFISDANTTSAELSDSYIKMINELALDDDFIDFSPSSHSSNGLWGHTLTTIKLQYPKSTLKELLKMPLASMINKMKQVPSYGEKRYNPSLGKRPKLTPKARKIRQAISKYKKYLNAALSSTSKENKYKNIVKALSSLTWRMDGSFYTGLLKVVHNVIGADNYSIKAIITAPEDTELRFPARAPLVNERNTSLVNDFKFFEYEFNEPEEIWDIYH